MGPPPRSFAADAHDCIMVRVFGPTEYKVVARLIRAPERGLPSDRHPDRIERAAVLRAVKVWPGKGRAHGKVGATANLDSSCARRLCNTAGRGEETGFQVEQRNRSRKEERKEERKIAALKPLDNKSPIQGSGLVLPVCNTEAMQLHLDDIAAKVAPRAHAILIFDQAGWHGAKSLKTPSNVSLIPLPPRAPELNPQENIWQFMRANSLSNRVFKSYDDIVNHCCYAWNTLVDQPWKIMSIARRDWAAISQSL